jgi:hypothetical protein
VKKAQDEITKLGGEASDKGRWMDLLKGIDLVSNRVGGGQWQKTTEGLLLTGSDNSNSRMVLPVIPEGSYEFEFQFVRKRGIEIDAFLPVGKGATTLVINGFGGPISALLLVRGALSDDAIFRNTQIVNGRPSVVRVRVVLDKDNAQVAVEMDGKEILAWKGPQSALSPHPLWTLPDLRWLGIGGLSSDVLFQGARLRMLSGKAVPLRQATLTVSAGNKPSTGKLVIVKAVYGDLPSGNRTDVTEKVAAMVKDNALSVDATNENFGDPADWCVKKLRVDYTFNGVAKSKTVDERQTLTISATGE